MTIHELLALTGLTGSDEIPVWDAEASGEPTKKITAQNFAAAVKTLASLLGTGDVVNDLTRGSNNPVSSGGVYDALVAKTEWKTFMTATNVSVGNTYAPTGKSFTLTKPAIVRIDMAYGSGRPLAIGIKGSESTSSGSIALTSVVASDISDTSGLSVTALLAAGTYYIWARTASASGSTSFGVYGMELGA